MKAAARGGAHAPAGFGCGRLNAAAATAWAMAQARSTSQGSSRRPGGGKVDGVSCIGLCSAAALEL
jgi:hypothetical protein